MARISVLHVRALAETVRVLYIRSCRAVPIRRGTVLHLLLGGFVQVHMCCRFVTASPKGYSPGLAHPTP